MNKLTAFLEEENKEFIRYYDVPLGDLLIRDAKLINTLLDIVGEEIEKERYYHPILAELRCGSYGGYIVDLHDIKQILTNLKK